MQYQKIVATILLLVSSPFLSLNVPPRKTPSSIRHESFALVIVFMRPFEELEQETQYQTPQIKEALHKNQYAISNKIINNKFNPSGMPETLNLIYAGFTDTINHNGEARFPRLTQNETIDLIITRKLHPVVIHGNTVEFLLRDTNTEIAYYKLQRMRDEDLDLLYWDVTEQPIPESKKISPYALIIFADPKNIYVRTGKFAAMEGANLLLPTIYTKAGLEKEYDSLKFLRINHFFSPIHNIIKIAPPQRYATRIQI